MACIYVEYEFSKNKYKIFISIVKRNILGYIINIMDFPFQSIYLNFVISKLEKLIFHNLQIDFSLFNLFIL